VFAPRLIAVVRPLVQTPSMELRRATGTVSTRSIGGARLYRRGCGDHRLSLQSPMGRRIADMATKVLKQWRARIDEARSGEEGA
jgi:hypothetical protein